MSRVLLFMAAAGLAAGCAAQPVSDPAPAITTVPPPAPAAMPTPDQLDGTSWRFVEIAGAPVPDDVMATIQFRHGRAAGRAGCNSYGATYRIEADGTAAFQLGMSTKMACVEPAGATRVEQGVFAAIRGVARAEVRGDGLVLLDSRGRVLARLVRASRAGR